MTSKIRIACIGAGYFARYHVHAWKRLPEVELVAICDKDIQKAKDLGHEFGVDHFYSDVSYLCEEEPFEVADIITPPETHLSLCADMANHSKHIICQKPLAPSLKEAEKILDCVREAGIRFMVHENFRFQPWYRQIKNMLDSGTIGNKLHSIYFRMRTGDGWGENAYLDRQPYFRKMPQLFIYETGIHFIDVFRFLAGEVTSVYARLRKLNPVISGEDCGIVLFDFENGTQGILDGNRYNEPNYPNPRYTFGEMMVEGNGGTIRLLPSGNITLQQLGKPEETISYHHEDIGFGGDCVLSTQKHFIKAYLENSSFETSGEAYLKNLIVQDAIYKSQRSNKPFLII